MSKITNKELTDQGICPTCYDREHNHIVFGDNSDKMLYVQIQEQKVILLFLLKSITKICWNYLINYVVKFMFLLKG